MVSKIKNLVMKIVTFCGKCSTLKRVSQFIHHDYFFVDRSFHDEFPSYLDNLVLVDTGVPYTTDAEEMIKKRLRIRRMYQFINDMIPQNEDLLILDSDVYVKDISKLPVKTVPYNLAIYAVLKPSTKIDIFYGSTNIFIPSTYREKLRQILNSYDSNVPVDLYINWNLGSLYLYIKGVCHIINGVDYCT